MTGKPLPWRAAVASQDVDRMALVETRAFATGSPVLKSITLPRSVTERSLAGTSFCAADAMAAAQSRQIVNGCFMARFPVYGVMVAEFPVGS
jgi:hypothetical protein